MKSIIAAAVLGIFCSLAQADSLPQPSLDINCSGVGGFAVTPDSFVSYGAATTDAALAKSKSILTMPGSIEIDAAYGELRDPVYKTSQKVDLGYGYTMNLDIKLEKDQAMGDFLFDIPKLTLSATLFFNGVAINAAQVSTQNIVNRSRYDGLDGKKHLEAEVDLGNLPLMAFLSVPNSNSLIGDLDKSVSTYKNPSELYQKFGTSAGVLTTGTAGCEVTIPWTPTEERLAQ